jgi:hypothetical protein
MVFITHLELIGIYEIVFWIPTFLPVCQPIYFFLFCNQKITSVYICKIRTAADTVEVVNSTNLNEDCREFWAEYLFFCPSM